MDLSGDKEPGCIDPSSRGSSGSISEARGPKSCADCRTTKTPLWRGGPSGPKSLCNACGIRYRKARRESMGLKGDNKKKRREKRTEETTMGLALKLQLLGMGTDVFLKQRRSWLQSPRRKLGEEEQAAVLLMALSSGFL